MTLFWKWKSKVEYENIVVFFPTCVNAFLIICLFFDNDFHRKSERATVITLYQRGFVSRVFRIKCVWLNTEELLKRPR